MAASGSPSELPGLAVIGGGPAGLMAAEVARAAGVEVDVFEGKGSVGRKFLIAGKGGLNLTHAEPMPGFARRYGPRERTLADWLRDFGADDLREDARLGRAQVRLPGLDAILCGAHRVAHRAALIDGDRKPAAGVDQPRR